MDSSIGITISITVCGSLSLHSGPLCHMVIRTNRWPRLRQRAWCLSFASRCRECTLAVGSATSSPPCACDYSMLLMATVFALLLALLAAVLAKDLEDVKGENYVLHKTLSFELFVDKG
ncbi:hypothetical protein J6590_077726 [Homalodisca vitripennis]|nr:hypothetical protein J6590_077726 [Homalodisca vitripennis]